MLSSRTPLSDRLVVWSKILLDSAEMDARGLFRGLTKIFPNRIFSHRLAIMLKLVSVKMPKTSIAARC